MYTVINKGRSKVYKPPGIVIVYAVINRGCSKVYKPPGIIKLRLGLKY